MWLQSKNAIYTTKFVAKWHQKNNTENDSFNPPFSLNVKLNVAKMFLQLVDTHFPPANKLYKIFNRNSVKVSYSCIQKLLHSALLKDIIRKLHR